METEQHLLCMDLWQTFHKLWNNTIFNKVSQPPKPFEKSPIFFVPFCEDWMFLLQYGCTCYNPISLYNVQAYLPISQWRRILHIESDFCSIHLQEWHTAETMRL